MINQENSGMQAKNIYKYKSASVLANQKKKATELVKARLHSCDSKSRAQGDHPLANSRSSSLLSYIDNLIKK